MPKPMATSAAPPRRLAQRGWLWAAEVWTSRALQDGTVTSEPTRNGQGIVAQYSSAVPGRRGPPGAPRATRRDGRNLPVWVAETARLTALSMAAALLTSSPRTLAQPDGVVPAETSSPSDPEGVAPAR